MFNFHNQATISTPQLITLHKDHLRLPVEIDEIDAEPLSPSLPHPVGIDVLAVVLGDGGLGLHAPELALQVELVDEAVKVADAVDVDLPLRGVALDLESGRGDDVGVVGEAGRLGNGRVEDVVEEGADRLKKWVGLFSSWVGCKMEHPY